MLPFEVEPVVEPLAELPVVEPELDVEAAGDAAPAATICAWPSDPKQVVPAATLPMLTH